MSLLKGKRPATDDVRRIALAALTAALDDGGSQEKPKRFKGVRTLAAGAALYTAGVAAFKNRDAILDRLRDEDEADFDDEEYEDDAAAEQDFDDEDYDDEPEAEEDVDDDEEDVDEEDFEDEDYEDEPEAEEDFEEDEPEADEDEDYEEEDDDEAEDSAGSRPPAHADRGSPDEQDTDIPDPPSRRRKPVGRR